MQHVRSPWRNFPIQSTLVTGPCGLATELTWFAVKNLQSHKQKSTEQQPGSEAPDVARGLRESRCHDPRTNRG